MKQKIVCAVIAVVSSAFLFVGRELGMNDETMFIFKGILVLSLILLTFEFFLIDRIQRIKN